MVATLDNETRIVSEPFSLDRSNECLWKGPKVIKLRPKAYAVLNHLVGRWGQLVTKEELLAAVWPETFVGDAVLKVAIRQLRDALQDDSKSPTFIETAHRRGYRFIGQIDVKKQVPPQKETADGHALSTFRDRHTNLPVGFVGRDEALSQMRSWLEKTLAGSPQIIFVSGEAGIGKTALVDTFARYIAFDQNIRIARGQCIEQYGTSEVYLPILEAIARLCREDARVVEVLRAHAPTWLLQLPSLVSASDRQSLSRETFGATRERMLREIGGALEALTADQPLALILEDLHWSDYSTLDLISYLATQRQASHLMLIGTYRPVDLIMSGHPLKGVKQELLAKRQCEELPLEYLSQEEVAKYLTIRFPGNRFPADLAPLIHERTEGNPLFMVNVLDYLLAEGLIRKSDEQWSLKARLDELEVGVPENIRQMIAKQIARLSTEDQQVLEAASISGMTFSALAIASALGQDVVDVEMRCEELARRNCFLRARGTGEFPDGTVSARYGFIHALYVNALYERIPAARRSRLHKGMAERGELIYGRRVDEIATELAVHFEQGRDYRRAAKYLKLAAEKAIRRFAYREAVGPAHRGLELLSKLPDSPERAQDELGLQLTLGVPLMATEGYAAPEVGSVYSRARELCRQVGETPDISEVLWGLRTYHNLRAEFQIALEIGEEFLRLSERLPYPNLAMRGHWAMEASYSQMGEFTLAIEHFEKALSLYDPKQHLDDSFLYGLNPGVAMPSFACWALWCLGRPDQALERINEALTLARELTDPQGLAHALFFAAILHQMRREAQLAQENAEAAIAISKEHGLVFYQAMATITRCWTLIEQGQPEDALEQMHQGLAALRSTGVEIIRPQLLALLADALGKMGQPEKGLRVAEEALEVVHQSGERNCEAELYRLKGELLLTKPAEPILAEAEACFNESIRIAQEQRAKSWELRTALSLGRLYKHTSRHETARNLISQVYESFTEGLDTLDLREAKTLLGD